MEWKKLKYDLLLWKEYILKDIVDGKKGIFIEWLLKRVLVMKLIFGQFYLRFVQVVEVVFVIFVFNVWLERGVSQLKLIKIRIRSQIKNDLFVFFFYIFINGFVLYIEVCDFLVSKVVDMWKVVKKRRKFLYYRLSIQL